VNFLTSTFCFASNTLASVSFSTTFITAITFGIKYQKPCKWRSNFRYARDFCREKRRFLFRIFFWYDLVSPSYLMVFLPECSVPVFNIYRLKVCVEISSDAWRDLGTSEWRALPFDVNLRISLATSSFTLGKILFWLSSACVKVSIYNWGWNVQTSKGKKRCSETGSDMNSWARSAFVIITTSPSYSGVWCWPD